jgi:hypothetical protein
MPTEGLRVADAVVERGDGLARERAAGGVGDGDADHHGHAGGFADLVEDALDGEDGGLGVEGVEDRLDQQRIDAAVEQRAICSV